MCPVPEGLFVCAGCGEIRGKTPDGLLSVCLCHGVVCDWCGARARRPISDHFDGRQWLHTPYFILMGHVCPAPRERKVGRQWRSPATDDDLRAYQQAMTRRAFAEIEGRTGVWLGRPAVGRRAAPSARASTGRTTRKD
jgi:hypothetical protein